SRWVLRRFHNARIIRTAIAANTKVKSLFPNSIAPCIPISGVVTYDSGVQRGHSEHPKPEAVKRTAPPVTIMPACDTTEATPRIIVHRVKVRGASASNQLRSRTAAEAFIKRLPLHGQVA